MKSRARELAVYGALFGGAVLCMCIAFILDWVTGNTLLLTVTGILALPVMFAVHLGLRRVYLMHARRFCKMKGFAPVRWREGPAFDSTGVKTEFSILELDCHDGQGRRKLVRLLVWPFGVRKVLGIEEYPSQDAVPSTWVNCAPDIHNAGESDWRLAGQENYLKGVTLFHRYYRRYAKNPTWDHDHCSFCWATFMVEDRPEALHRGYATHDDYHWVCEKCFEDFRNQFDWKVVEELTH